MYFDYEIITSTTVIIFKKALILPRHMTSVAVASHC